MIFDNRVESTHLQGDSRAAVAREVCTRQRSRGASNTYDREMATTFVTIDLDDHGIACLMGALALWDRVVIVRYSLEKIGGKRACRRTWNIADLLRRLGNPNDVCLERLRVAVFTDDGIGTPTKETKEAVERACRELETAGLSVTKARPSVVSRSPDLWLRAMIPSWAIAMRYWQREYARMAGSEVFEERSPLMEFLLKALDVAAANSDCGLEREEVFQRALQDFRQKMLHFMTDYDVLLSPVVNAPADPHMTPDDIAKLPVEEFLNLAKAAMGGYFCTHNLTGWPAVVVRAGTSPEGLPIGVQIAAKAWREDVALSVANVVEKRCGGWQRSSLL